MSKRSGKAATRNRLQGPPPGLSARCRIGWVHHQLQALLRSPFKGYKWLLMDNIPRDGVVFDLGANLGYFTKLMSEVATDGLVYAVEPLPYASSILVNSIIITRRQNVLFLPVAISDAVGDGTICSGFKANGKLSHGGATLYETDRPDVGCEIAVGNLIAHSVPITSFDTLVEQLNVSKVDFIKIDIEGHEQRFVLGAARTLRTLRPIVMMEVKGAGLAHFGGTLLGIWALMRGSGYAPFDIESACYCPILEPRDGRHILWVPVERHMRARQ